MKTFSTLLAAACLASVQAHTMLVCTATSCNTPGRVTIFLGTYHNEPRNPNAPQSPGGVTVTTMSGDNYDFPFAATCEGYSDLKGSDDFSTLKKSFMAHNQDAQPSGSGVITNSCRSQGETNPAAGGKPIIDDDSIITCFNGDKNVDGSPATTVAGVPMAAEWTTSGKTFCAYNGSPCHGFYYMVMDNVLPGDYTIQGWTTDQILASGSNAGVCGVIGYGGDEQRAKSASKEYAFSLSVATQQCSAGTGARCSAPSAEQFGAGLALSTTEVCDKEGGAMPGYMCSAKCKSGYTQAGTMICGADGAWGGFQCVAADSAEKPCSMGDVSVTNYKAIEYSSAGCGYTSHHNALCSFSCSSGIKVGGEIKCDNGVWVNDNGAECKDIVDVHLKHPAAPTLSQEKFEKSIKVEFNTVTECSSGVHCSAAKQYEVAVTDSFGSLTKLQCGNWNSGVAPSNGMQCSLPAGVEWTDIEYSVAIGVTNGAGTVFGAPASITPIGVPKDPCFVHDAKDASEVGPAMRNNIDVFGRDWVKYWSADGNYGPTRAETFSAHACCEACKAEDGCDYWTYHKGSWGCYLKSQDDHTVYVDQYNPDRVSGALSPTTFNKEMHGKWHESTGWIPDVDGNTRRRLAESTPTLTAVLTEDLPEWPLVSSAGNGYACLTSTGAFSSTARDCVIQASAHPELCDDYADGQCYCKLADVEQVCGAIDDCAGVFCPDWEKGTTHECAVRSAAEMAKTTPNKAGNMKMKPCPSAFPYKIAPGFDNSKYGLCYKDHSSANGGSGSCDSWCAHAGEWPTVKGLWGDDCGSLCLTPDSTSVLREDLSLFRPIIAEGHLVGVDFAGDDWVKFSNGRVEAASADDCEKACVADDACGYWTFAPNEPELSCYLKNEIAMESRAFGYGRPVLTYNVVSGVQRYGGVEAEGGVGSEVPVVYPQAMMRKFINQMAAPKELPYPSARPELYMLGSCITESYIDNLAIGVINCTHIHYENPCFYSEEVDSLHARLMLEKEHFAKLSDADKKAALALGHGLQIDEGGETMSCAAAPVWHGDKRIEIKGSALVSTNGLACVGGDPVTYKNDVVVCRDSCSNEQNCDPDGCDGEQKCVDVCCGSSWHD